MSSEYIRHNIVASDTKIKKTSKMLCLLTLVLILLPVLYYLYLYLSYDDAKWQAEYRARYGVPYEAQPSLLKMFFTKENIEQQKLISIRKVGKVFGCNMFMRNTIMLAQPELIQTVMSKEFTNFTNRRPFSTSDPLFKHAVSNTQDEIWKRQRAIITPTFATGKLRNMMPRVRVTLRTMINNMDEVLAKQDSKKGFDIKKIANSFTMDTIAQVAFGLELDSLKDPNNEIVKYGQKLFAVDLTLARTVKFILFNVAPRLSELLGLELNHEVNQYFRDLVRKVLHGKREMLRQNSSQFRPTNFIELLLEAEAEFEKHVSDKDEDEDNKKGLKFMTNEEVISQSVLFYIAGFETTASIISLTLHELAMNGTYQDKVYREIETVLATLKSELGNDNLDPIDIVDLDHLNKFTYLNAVVNETLRLHSPGPFTERQASKDLTLSTEDGRYNVNVYKGDVVHIPIVAIHLDDDNFSEPKKFKPERFLEPVHHNYAYLPFGQGPRNCVAKSFALMEVKLAVLQLIYRYKFSRCVATKEPVEIFFQNLIQTPKAVPLKIEKRL